MLTWRTDVYTATLPHLNVKHHELFIGAEAFRTRQNANVVVIHFSMQKVEEMGPPYRVDPHAAILDRPVFDLQAVAMARDLQTDDTLAKSLVHDFGIGWVIANIDDNEVSGTMKSVNLRERLCRALPNRPCGNCSNCLSASNPGINKLVPPTTAVERSRLRPTSWAIMTGARVSHVLRCTGVCGALEERKGEWTDVTTRGNYEEFALELILAQARSELGENVRLD